MKQHIAGVGNSVAKCEKSTDEVMKIKQSVRKH